MFHQPPMVNFPAMIALSQHRLQTIILAMVLLVCNTPAWAAEEDGSAEGDLVTINFVNSDIEGVVKVISEMTGRNFVLDPRVKGTINIVSAQPISRALVYKVFQSALRLQGFATIEDHGMVKIVPEADAKMHPGVTLQPPGSDQLQTRVFTLRYVSAALLVPILRPLVSPNNALTAYQNSNALVITDYTNNLQRLAGIIRTIDQPSGSDPIIIPLKYASAVDVANTVRRLFAEVTQVQGITDPTQRFTVAADTRSNSLMVDAGDPSRLSRIRKFVATLDSPTNAAGNIHVVYLKNAEAVVLAETLRAIYQGNSDSPTSFETAGGRTPASAQDQGPMSVGSIDGGRANVASSPAGIIQADEATNSIIITAPDAIYNSLRAALDKLDARRAQVYVEALIVELSADKAAEIGIQWQNLGGLDETGTQGFGGTNFGGTGQNIIGISRNPVGVDRGLNIGVVDGLVNIAGIGQFSNIGVLARALETHANANILSTPTLLTLDNEAASIVIGQNVPFITGQYSSLQGAGEDLTPFQTIERQDVGLTLQVKPQISESGVVRLKIYQEVSSVQDTTNPAGLITNKRAVETTVLVDNQQTVVIGGLIQDEVNNNVEKVPLLGDIPLLGGLFRFKSRSQIKTNLMVFLRPTIVRNSEHGQTFTSERYEYILEEQRQARPEPSSILPEMDSPVLPPWKPFPASPPESEAGSRPDDKPNQ